MATLTYGGVLVTRRCWCGIRHAIPEELNRHINENNNASAYCPLGHSYVNAGKTDAERLKEERAQAYARETSLRDQLDAERRSKAAVKGALTKAKKRAGAGVCPVAGCKRSFSNLRRHVQTQHPSFLVDDHSH